MLEDDNKQQQEQQPELIQSADDYVKALSNLKASTVDKKEYDKLVQEKQTLIKALAEGETVSSENAQGDKKVDLTELRKKIFNADESMTNAEYVENVLKLRSAIIAEGGLDPFLPSGEKIQPDVNDIKGASKVAEALQDCLDSSRGDDGKVDPELFNAYLNKMIAPDSSLLTARLKASKRN